MDPDVQPVERMSRVRSTSRFLTDLPARMSLGVIALGYAIAAVLGLGLAYDGSFFLFQTLNTGQPLVPYNRFVHWPLLEPLVVARSLTESPRALAAILTFSYLMVPLVSLVASWWIVRRKQPRLFVWSVIGIGLVSLPGQPFMVSEGIMAIQLSWPILLAFLAGDPRDHRLIIVAFSLVLAFAHPTAVPILGAIAVAGMLLGRRRGNPISIEKEVQAGERSQAEAPPSPRPARAGARTALANPYFRWATVVGGVALVALVRTLGSEFDVTHGGSYSAQTLTFGFGQAVMGPPLLMLGLVYAACALIVVAGAMRRRMAAWRHVSAGRVELLALGLLTLGGAALLPWAADPHSWWKALDYRFFAVLLAIPPMAMALLDVWLDEPAGGRAAVEASSGVGFRNWIALSQAVVAMAVLSAFALSFHDLQTRLLTQVESEPNGCVTVWWRDWVSHSPLDHWATTADSLVVQGREPTRVALRACYPDFAGGVPITDWQTVGYEGGWFDFSKLQVYLVGEPAVRLEVATVATAKLGSPHSIKVTAYDSAGNIAAGYRGTVHFTSSDPKAKLPADYTFTRTDSGVHYFMFDMTLGSTGNQTVSIVDSAAPAMAGSDTVKVTR